MADGSCAIKGALCRNNNSNSATRLALLTNESERILRNGLDDGHASHGRARAALWLHKLLELIANEPEPATLPEALASVDQQGAEHQDWLVDVAAIVAVLLGWLTQQR